MALRTSMAEALRLTRAGNLAEATTRLRAALAGGMPPAGPVARAAAHEALPVAGSGASTPGRFEARHHVGTVGALDYMLYRPADTAAGAPLVLMLHGCTQSPEDFARGTRMNALADEMGFLVAYPRQAAGANPQRCWNWFNPREQGRERGEVALIAGVIEDVVAAERVDPARVYAAGLSAGGAAVANLALAYPERLAAVGIHSGLAAGAARDLSGALAAMRGGAEGRAAAVPVITFHGDRDRTVHPANADAIVRAATAAAGTSLATTVEKGTVGGRGYTTAIGRDAAGRAVIEQWTVAGAGHAWSGGDPAGSYADAAGPDASRAMLRFFLDHRRR